MRSTDSRAEARGGTTRSPPHTSHATTLLPRKWRSHDTCGGKVWLIWRHGPLAQVQPLSVAMQGRQQQCLCLNAAPRQICSCSVDVLAAKHCPVLLDDRLGVPALRHWLAATGIFLVVAHLEGVLAEQPGDGERVRRRQHAAEQRSIGLGVGARPAEQRHCDHQAACKQKGAGCRLRLQNGVFMVRLDLCFESEVSLGLGLAFPCVFMLEQRAVSEAPPVLA